MTRREMLGRRLRTAAAVVVLRAGVIGAKFGITLFIARFMDLDTLGLYGFVAGATVVLPILTGLGLIGVLARTSVEQDPADLIRVFAPYWAMLAALYAAIAAASLPWAYHAGQVILALLVCAIIFVEHLNADIFVVLNHRRSPQLANLLLVVRTVVWIGCYTASASCALAPRNLPALLAFWLGGAYAALFSFFWVRRDWPWRVALELRPGLRELRVLIRRARTLYFNGIANAGGQYVDRYLVGAFLGLELAGVYFLFWSLTNALSNLVDAGLLQVQQPGILSSRSDRREQGRRLGRLRIEALVACALLGAATALLAPQLLALIERPAFSGQAPVLIVLIVGFVLRIAYEVEGIGFYARHEDRSTLLSGLAVLALSVSITTVLTPVLGLFGPASAIVTAYAAGGLWRSARNRSADAACAALPPPDLRDDHG